MRRKILSFLLPLGPEMSHRKEASPSKLFPVLFLWSGGSAHPGQPPDSAPDRRPPCCAPSSQVPDQRYDCNIPFSIHLSVSRSHLGVLRCPASSCCPLLPPSSQTVAAGHESGPLSIAETQEDSSSSVCRLAMDSVFTWSLGAGSSRCPHPSPHRLDGRASLRTGHVSDFISVPLQFFERTWHTWDLRTQVAHNPNTRLRPTEWVQLFNMRG
ncbi:uncharacterized protein ACBT57_008083 isoform 2-T3 [Dama dama]